MHHKNVQNCQSYPFAIVHWFRYWSPQHDIHKIAQFTSVSYMHVTKPHLQKEMISAWLILSVFLTILLKKLLENNYNNNV